MVKHASGGEFGQDVSALRVDERGRALDAHRAQQGFEQDDMVFAVAVTVGQDALRVVRHHAARAKVDADVADVVCHPVVEFAHFVFVAFAVLGELVGQRLDVWRDLRFGISPLLVGAPYFGVGFKATRRKARRKVHEV